jgi:hypothetical protein
MSVYMVVWYRNELQRHKAEFQSCPKSTGTLAHWQLKVDLGFALAESLNMSLILSHEQSSPYRIIYERKFCLKRQ